MQGNKFLHSSIFSSFTIKEKKNETFPPHFNQQHKTLNWSHPQKLFSIQRKNASPTRPDPTFMFHSESLSTVHIAFNPLGLCINQTNPLSLLAHRNQNTEKRVLDRETWRKRERERKRKKEIQVHQPSTFLLLFFSLTSYLSWHISVNHAPGLTNCNTPKTKLTN